MNHEMLPLARAAAHVHVETNELRHIAQRGEIAAQKRGDEWYFDHVALDEWAQRNLLAVSKKELEGQHRVMLAEQRRDHHEGWGVSDFMSVAATSLRLTAKNKAGLLRDMTDLVDLTGHVNDREALYQALVEREEAASTAIGEGVALLHPRFHDPYLFDETLVAYGRSEREIFFGAPNGEGTRHFFLICSTDHEQHLHILARLAVLAHGTDLVARLNEIETAEDALELIAACEAEYRK